MKDIKTAEEVIQDDLNLITTDKDLQYLFIGVCEKYHKAKIDSISDEEIKKMFTTEHFSQSNGRYYRTRVERITGARMFKNKLLNDL